MVKVLVGVYDLYKSFENEDAKAQDADDAAEAAQAQIDGVDEELAEDDPEALADWVDAPEPANLFGAGVGALGAVEFGQDPDGASRGEYVEKILDASIVLASLLPGVLIGGAVIGFAQRAAKRLKKFRKRVNRKKPRPRRRVCKTKPCRKQPYRCQRRKSDPAKPRLSRKCDCPNKRLGCRGVGCSAKPGNCFVAGTLVDGAWRIEDAVLGTDVRTWLPGEPGYVDASPVEVTVREREIGLMQESEGGNAKVQLLRGEPWCEANRLAKVGDWIDLNLEEMDIRGRFQVIELGELVEIKYVRRAGYSRVTGTFEFSHGKTFNLYIQGESAPIGVTGLHPIWSVDRLNWVEVWDLNVGERVLVEGGTRVVEKVDRRGEEEVFNIEVEGEHCYRVGEQGVLVHNASALPIYLIGQNQLGRVNKFDEKYGPFKLYMPRNSKTHINVRNLAWIRKIIRGLLHKCEPTLILYDIGFDIDRAMPARLELFPYAIVEYPTLSLNNKLTHVNLGLKEYTRLNSMTKKQEIELVFLIEWKKK